MESFIKKTDNGDLVIPAESVPEFVKALDYVLDVAAWGSNLIQVGDNFNNSHKILSDVLREVK